jgi:hypothetical protein
MIVVFLNPQTAETREKKLQTERWKNCIIYAKSELIHFDGEYNGKIESMPFELFIFF